MTHNQRRVIGWTAAFALSGATYVSLALVALYLTGAFPR